MDVISNSLMKENNIRNHILILGDTRTIGHHGCNIVVQVLLKQLQQRSVTFDIASHQQDIGQILESKRFNAVVINGEGSIHGRSQSAKKYAQVCEISAKLSVPCFIINSVLDKLQTDTLKQLTNCTKIYCRESASLKLAQDFGIASSRCADLTFGLRYDIDMSLTANSDRIVVTDSTVDTINRKLHSFAVEHQLYYLPLRTNPSHIDFKTFKSPIRRVKFLVRNQLGKLRPGSYQFDRFGKAERYFEKFANRLKSGTRFVLCGRFHAVCFCLNLGIPFLAVGSNTHKIQGLLEDANLSHKLLTLRSDESNSGKGLAFKNFDVTNSGLVSALTERAVWTHHDERNRLAYVQNARTEITKCFDEILHEIVNQNSQSKNLVRATI